MRAFIIRPFGTKKGIDFNAVEERLIDPALKALGITGRTTLDIVRQGNIRLDMFQRLLTADVVIADVSIHNANVFYELGIRHALRDKRTFLIRCQRDDVPPDEIPFDLKTDRYLSYPKDDPAACLNELVTGLRQTINSELQDSPVFMLLPELQAQDRSRFLPVPLDFQEEVERAAEGKQVGDLGLLAEEVRGFEWEIEGLRIVGRAQFNLRAFESARVTWETVRTFDVRDGEANIWLGTVYERLGDLVRSDQALKRALERRDLAKEKRAEMQALLARNAKTRWTQSWESAAAGERQAQALGSPYLEQSFEAYERAFSEDLNHYYSGVNALSMLTILVELAEAQPDVWAARFDADAEGVQQLQQRKERRQKLSGAVDVSVDAAMVRLKREDKRDVWAEITAADLCLLTSKRPARVATAYRNALAGAPDFVADSARAQARRYQQLGILSENVKAALDAIPPEAKPPDAAAVAAAPRRVLLFTGHMIDAPTRQTPRFPPEKTEVARQAIMAAVVAEQQKSGGIAYGIAGGASGGDILFHQVCEELAIPTRIFLALPRDQYVTASVAHAGPEWIREFDRLRATRPVRVLGESKELQRWLQEKPNYTIWQRNNLWMLFNALAAGGANVTLIALWNGQAGDGPGGTADMVSKAAERGASTIVLDTKALFGP